MENFATIYYDEFKNLFAIVDLKTNCLLDFGIATEVKYAEIFIYKSYDTVNRQEICENLKQQKIFSTPDMSTGKYKEF